MRTRWNEWNDQGIFEVADAYRKQLFNKDISEYREAANALRREMLKKDPNCPKYHFTTPEGLVISQDVTIYYKGLYHMFYLYLPTFEGNRVTMWSGFGRYMPDSHFVIAWGHAVSEDLVHWRDMPVAMWPEEEFETLTQMSGECFFTPDGEPWIFYGGAGDEYEKDNSLILARPKDDMLNTWEKQTLIHHDGPIDTSVMDFVGRIWKHEDTYYMSTGRRCDGHGAGYLLVSKDLLNWEVSNVFFERGNDRTWETPIVFPVDGKDVFIVAYTPRIAGEAIQYWIGRFDYETRRFVPDLNMGRPVDPGHLSAHYIMDDTAAKHNGKDRTILTGWIDDRENKVDGGVPFRAGSLTLPRELHIQDETLSQSVIPEIDTLITEVKEYGTKELLSGETFEIRDTSDAYKLSFRRRRGRLDHKIVLEFVAFTQEDGKRTENTNGYAAAKLILETNGSVAFEGIRKGRVDCMFNPIYDAVFHIYVDRSIVEIYVEEINPETGTSISRVYTGVIPLSCGIAYSGRTKNVWIQSNLDGINIKGRGVLEDITVSKMDCIWGETE